MPTMAPGLDLFARLQPFVIGVGDVIIILTFAVSALLTIVMAAYVLAREWGWWSRGEEPPQTAQARQD